MRLSVDEKKRLLLSEFSEWRQHILDTAALIPPDYHDQAFLGIWSIKDLLAHLIGWDYANIEAVKAVIEGKLPEFYGYIDKDWRSYNARLVGLYKKDTVFELIRDARVSHRALNDQVAEIPAKELFGDKGVRYRGYKVTLARLIEADIKDARIHSEQIREFMARIGIKGNPL